MRIRFLKDALYESGGRLTGPTFLAGEAYDLREDLALRWIRRGKAVAETELQAADAQLFDGSAADGVAGAPVVAPKPARAPRRKPAAATAQDEEGLSHGG